MELKDRLTLFQEMVLCCHNLYFWTYDSNLNLLETNCPDVEMVQHMFHMGDGREILLTYAREHSKPIIMTNLFGLMWIAVPQREESTWGRIYILGPFFTADLSEQVLEVALEQFKLNDTIYAQAEHFLQSLPILSQNRAFEYAIMLYYCISGERISVSDLHYQEGEEAEQKTRPRTHRAGDVHGTYAMEQEMVRMVREGNLNIQRHMSRMALTGSMGKLSDDPNRQMKNALLVCITLFSRAAIEGGLSPEIALAMSDHYIQSVESCKNLQELQILARTMQDDYVTRVHRIRNSTISKPIQEVCDYINLHLEENPTLSQIAANTKYSKCYLSRRFREEIGVSVGTYIMTRRLEHAKDLLQDNKLSAKEVGERLKFCSASYFAKQFKAVYGLGPTEWREQHIETQKK